MPNDMMTEGLETEHDLHMFLLQQTSIDNLKSTLKDYCQWWSLSSEDECFNCWFNRIVNALSYADFDAQAYRNEGLICCGLHNVSV